MLIWEQIGIRKGFCGNIPDLSEFADTESCYDIVEAIHKKHKWLRQDAGFFVQKNGKAADHAWLAAPDGSIVDPTYGQFSGKVEVKVWKKTSTTAKRYYSWDQHHNPHCLIKQLKVRQTCYVCGYDGEK